YSEAVPFCHNEACLLPREVSNQKHIRSRLQVSPRPAVLDPWTDIFGNRMHYFAIQSPHSKMTVTATSEIETYPQPSLPEAETTPAWEHVRDGLKRDSDPAMQEAIQFGFESSYIEMSGGLVEYISHSFTPGRPILEASLELMQRIYEEFTYDPVATTVATPLPDVLNNRRGVCQDFAHLGIACLRAIGLPARYVSGYLETLPPPGQPKLQGSDASHAWFSVYIPSLGWVDLDPTNNKRPDEQYITTAWGRDYGDVTPLKGVLFGGGTHQLNVEVDVLRQN
ncbi:MAG: transglutaminase family protein, partial [Pseudomonadota bacterium]